MAVDKSLTDNVFDLISSLGQPENEIILDPVEEQFSDEMLIIEDDDGGVTIDFGGIDVMAGLQEAPFDANLSEYMEETDLMRCASKLVSMYEDDKSSRKDWEQSYKEGLDLLGLEMEDRTTPWPGACGVFHPLLSESVVRFQAQTIQEIFPARGPVKTRIWGKTTPETISQAQRVKEYMNYQLLEVMTEYRSETEKLLFSLPLSGAAFRKIYYDPTCGS